MGRRALSRSLTLILGCADALISGSQVTPQDLVDSYMAPFQDCVEQGEVTSLMCSYNSVNGVPSCANGWLLNTVARGEWEFDGYITSDCDADANVFTTHHCEEPPHL